MLYRQEVCYNIARATHKNEVVYRCVCHCMAKGIVYTTIVFSFQMVLISKVFHFGRRNGAL